MDYNKYTAAQLSSMLKKKEINAVELTEAALERIKKLDPEIRSFITITGDYALNQARVVQQKLDRNEELPPLAGIPAAIKDNMCTKGILTTCGSHMLENFIPPYDATVVKKLNEEQVVMLGKLNMDEFAMGSSNENSYFFKTKNPWDKQRVPGGSSGGAAAAVSSGQVVFSLGSDTGGSIRQPAAMCGVVGLKPTYGLVSRYGLVAFASSLDQIGPLTRDVSDCAMVLNAICGYDSMDSTSINRDKPDYKKALLNDVKGMKFGIPKQYLALGINNEVKDAILNAAKKLEEMGAVCEEFDFPLAEYAIPAYYLISSAEASSNLARYDGVKYGFRSENHTDLADMYRKTRSEGFGREVKNRIMLGTFALSSGYYDAYYKKALQVRTLIRQAFDNVFKKFDLVIGPTSPTTAFKIGEKSEDPLEMYLCDVYTVSANIAGIPGISIPCGFDSDKLPIGLQLMGRPFSEEILLKAAYTFEQNTGFGNLQPKILFVNNSSE